MKCKKASRCPTDFLIKDLRDRLCEQENNTPSDEEFDQGHKETEERGKALCRHVYVCSDVKSLQFFLANERPPHDRCSVDSCQSVGCDLNNLWICLNCATIACGPPDHKDSHISQHFSQKLMPKSKHTVAAHLTTFKYWCRICKKEVTPLSGGKMSLKNIKLHSCLNQMKDRFNVTKPKIKMSVLLNSSAAKAVIPSSGEECVTDTQRPLEALSKTTSSKPLSVLKRPDIMHLSTRNQEEKMQVDNETLETTAETMKGHFSNVDESDTSVPLNDQESFKNTSSFSDFEDSTFEKTPPQKVISSHVQTPDASPQRKKPNTPESTVVTPHNTKKHSTRMGRQSIYEPPFTHTYNMRERRARNVNEEVSSFNTSLDWLDIIDKKNVTVLVEDDDLVKCMQAITLESPGVRGLLNYGNTCFLNSVLQCLAQTPNFLPTLLNTCQGNTFLLPGDPDNGIPCLEVSLGSCGPVTRALIQTLAAIRDTVETTTIAPKNLIVALINHQASAINFKEQQDAMELLGYLVSALEDEQLSLFETAIETKTGKKVNKRCKEEDKSEADVYFEQATELPFSVFHGQVLNSLLCRPCQEVKSNKSPFFSLSLPITPTCVSLKNKELEDNGLDEEQSDSDTKYDNDAQNCNNEEKHKEKNPTERAQTFTIDSCLERFIADADLDDFECELCEENKTNNNEINQPQGHRQGSKISTLPAILVLHLLRFYYNDTSLSKLRTPVSYPKELDLAPYCVPPIQACGKALYSLYGVVTHAGTLNSGHYTACVQLDNNCVASSQPCETGGQDETGSNDSVSSASSDNAEESDNEQEEGEQWYKANDFIISKIEEKKVFENEAYILFYKRL